MRDPVFDEIVKAKQEYNEHVINKKIHDELCDQGEDIWLNLNPHIRIVLLFYVFNALKREFLNEKVIPSDLNLSVFFYYRFCLEKKEIQELLKYSDAREVLIELNNQEIKSRSTSDE